MSQTVFCFVFSLLVLALSPTHAWRKRINRARNGTIVDASFAVDSNASGPVVVHLDRVKVRATNSSAANSVDRSHVSFYLGKITVGTPPQPLQVLFDTASGHVLLPHKACESAACLEHHHYSPWASSTAVDVNFDGSPVEKKKDAKTMRSFATLEFAQPDLGDGNASAVLVREHVCMSNCSKGRQVCTDLALLAATKEDYQPFGAMPGDGIVGLSLEGLALSAVSSFFPNLLDSSRGMLPEFGISLTADGGEIIFGGRSTIPGHASLLQWFPVVQPDQGFWQVEIQAVRVGNILVDACEGGCRAIIDTGSSWLGVQKNRFEGLHAALAPAHVAAAGGCQGPPLQIQLPDGFALTLSADDYSDVDCKAELGTLNLEAPQYKGVYSLGMAVFRAYYASFDWKTARVGFAPHPGHPSLRMDSGTKSDEVVLAV